MTDPKPLPYALQRLIDAVEAIDDTSRFSDRRDVPELIQAAREAASAWRSIYGHIEASPGFGRVPDPVVVAAEPNQPITVLQPRAFIDIATADEAVRIDATPGKGVLLDDFRSDRPVLITHALTFDEVDEVAMERCALWHTDEDEPWVITDWTNAVCGEAGELANVAKKIRRIQTGTKRFATEQEREDALAELRAKAAKELADVELYLPMVANALGVHRATVVVAKFNEVSVREGFPQRLRSVNPSAGADQPHAFSAPLGESTCGCGEPEEHPVHMVRSVPQVVIDRRPFGERLAAGETIELRHDDPRPGDPPGSARLWAGGGFHTGPRGQRRCWGCEDCTSPFPVWCEAWGDPPPHIAEQKVTARHSYWRAHDHVFQPDGPPELATTPCVNCGRTERSTERHTGSAS